MSDCELCHRPLMPNAKYGVCWRRPRCYSENRRRENAAYRERRDQKIREETARLISAASAPRVTKTSHLEVATHRACSMCGGKVGRKNKYGVCNSKRECKLEYMRRYMRDHTTYGKPLSQPAQLTLNITFESKDCAMKLTGNSYLDQLLTELDQDMTVDRRNPFNAARTLWHSAVAVYEYTRDQDSDDARVTAINQLREISLTKGLKVRQIESTLSSARNKVVGS